MFKEMLEIRQKNTKKIHKYFKNHKKSRRYTRNEIIEYLRENDIPLNIDRFVVVYDHLERASWWNIFLLGCRWMFIEDGKEYIYKIVETF